MSSPSDYRPHHMTNARKQAVMAQSPMSSSTVRIEPHGHRRLEDMSLPYNTWAPDRHRHYLYHHSSHGHAPISPSQRGSRLPFPEGLMTASPSPAHSHHHNHHDTHPSPPASTTPSSDQLGASTRSPVSRPPLPSFPPIFAGATHEPPAENTENSRTPLQRGREARVLPSATTAGSDDSSVFHDPAGPRYARGPPLPPPKPPARGYHRRVQGTEFHCDSRRSLQQHVPASGPPSSQTQRLPPPYRQAPGTTAIAGMPNLLGPARAQALSDIRFRLSLRQQPKAARACGFGDRDRRVIDPPPIVQLVIESSSMTEDEMRLYLRYESYVMNCTICDETGTRDASFMPEEYQHQRRLMGSLVGTPFAGQDDKGKEGCFFCFGDLSCRTPGAFRLKFTLIMIDPIRAGMIRHFPILTEILSQVFYVYSAKEFPGMLPSSNLAKRLKEQGCIISIKKGNNERSKNARGQDDLSDVDDDDGEGSQGQRKRRATGD